MRNILRQITDIQVLAKRLTKRKTSLVEIEQFADYSYEIKSFLIQNINDDFVLKYIHDIPDLNIHEMENQTGMLYLILNWFGSGIGVYSQEQHKIEKALKTVREIRGKYASVEFMLKNHFS